MIALRNKKQVGKNKQTHIDSTILFDFIIYSSMKKIREITLSKRVYSHKTNYNYFSTLFSFHIPFNLS